MCLALRGYLGPTSPQSDTLLHICTLVDTFRCSIVNVPNPHELVTDYSHRMMLSSHTRWSLGPQTHTHHPPSVSGRGGRPGLRTERGSLILWRWGKPLLVEGRVELHACLPVLAPSSGSSVSLILSPFCLPRAWDLPSSISICPDANLETDFGGKRARSTLELEEAS